MSTINNHSYPQYSIENNKYTYHLKPVTHNLAKRPKDFIQLSTILEGIYLKTDKPLTWFEVNSIGKFLTCKCINNYRLADKPKDSLEFKKALQMWPIYENAVQRAITDKGYTYEVIRNSKL